jgi:hypothetical protein
MTEGVLIMFNSLKMAKEATAVLEIPQKLRQFCLVMVGDHLMLMS